MRPPAIIVTGAGGFVGSNLVQRLRELGRPVMALRRGAEASVDGGECQADITRAEQLAALVERGVRADVIVHLAGRVEIALRPDSQRPEESCRPAQTSVAQLYAANVMGTANVVDFALACGARKIVFASSQTVYGYGEDGKADEDTPLRPLEHYAASKVCAEKLLETTSRQGISVAVLRFPGVFATSRTAGAVYAMCRSAVLQRQITVQADCAIPVDVLALDDLLPAIVRGIDYEGEAFEVFNISTGEPCSLERLAERIGAQVPGTRIERRGVRQPMFEMNAGRAARLLQWSAASLDLRLAEMIAAVRA